MRTRGAVVTKAPGTYEVIDIDLEEPRQGEILVKLAASGARTAPSSLSA